MDYLLPTLTKKEEIDRIIRDTIDKVLVLRFGNFSDHDCLQLDVIVLLSLLSLYFFLGFLLSFHHETSHSKYHKKTLIFSLRNRREMYRDSLR